MTFFLVILWIGLCFVVAAIAKGKKRSYSGWFFISFLFSPLIGSLALLAAGEKKEEVVENQSYENHPFKNTEERKSRVFYTKAVGVTQCNDDGTSRQEILSRCTSGDSVNLVREPENPHDSNAIKLCLENGEQIGYIGKDLADRMAMEIDDGQLFKAEISEITGGTEDKHILGCNIKISVLEPQ